MRNLRNFRNSVWISPPEHQERQITATAWDTADDSIICAYGPGPEDPLIELVRLKPGIDSNQYDLITSWDAPSPNPDVSCDQILSLYYFSDSRTACVVLTGGDIVVVREEPLPGEDRIEIAGSVDVGISTAKWSPDEELLAITTNADTVVFMSRSFEGIMDVAMTSEDLKASNHVSVGWGKKETQFQGKGAKALRDPTMPEKVDEGVLSLHDEGQTAISWRGDGAFVAVSTIHEGTRRLVRVYSREGVLDSVSEPVDGLEGALSWRPAGNIIAGIQRFPERLDVVFFERNGLRHGQFSLRLTPTELLSLSKNVSLLWNCDSSVLAVIMEKSVQLWTMGNYHWYLKQEIPAAEGSNPVSLQWHLEKPLVFIISSKGRVQSLEYVFSTARGSTAPPNDHGAVGVIDGNTLKLTPFRSANVPPPMALHEVSVETSIIDVAFNHDTSSIAVLHHGGISLYCWKLGLTLPSLPALNGRFTFLGIGDENFPRQICFVDSDTLIVLHYNLLAGSSIRKYWFNDETGRMEEIPLTDVSGISPSHISSLLHDGMVYACAQGQSGDLHSLTLGEHMGRVSKFPLAVPWIEIAQHNNVMVAFGLSSNGHLYANSRCLAKNCSSFLVTSAHLVFTTTNHLLKFVHIAQVEDLQVPLDDPETDERCRSIERGARLVTAMPTSLSLILQMPRGNLETIWPRAMVLSGIRQLIEEKNYRKAFTHCRTQRVDMNILYDHHPQQFVANVGLFIDQVKKISYIDLFLSSLKEEDVAQTMYKETKSAARSETGIAVQNGINGIHKNGPITSKSKVNSICDAVLEVLETRQSTNLQNIITANVCKMPPALDDGLLVVAKLMGEDEKMAERAVEHICFLADANKLYDNALGLYNLDLALLVAQQSQKDPREYLPFLQRLQEMDQVRRHFSIDDHLGRHSKALSHLFSLSREDPSEFEAYTTKHGLYKPALSLTRYQPLRLNSIMALYAAHLESTSQFHSAALAYESLHQYTQATVCYQRASPSYWRESLFCASQETPPLSGPSLASLVTSLADSLYEGKDYLSSATLHETYLSSIPTAATILCKGNHFAAAMHLASRYPTSAPTLLGPNGTIDTGLADAFDTTTTLLSECKSQLAAQVPRIRDLRALAAADPLSFLGLDSNNPDSGIPDDVSVVSSKLSTSASLFTRYTAHQSLGTAASGVSRATSKNRRREERKRARGKKGSVYEEEYLVASVGRLVERVESVREEVGRLVVGLVRRGMRERAAAVEGLLGDVVMACHGAVAEVFGDGGQEGKDGREVVETGEGYTPVGGDAVLAEAVEEMGRRKVAPIIGPFEKLTLLGG